MSPRRTTTTSTSRSVHRLKVTLRYSQPPVWRRLAVPSTTTLRELHHILQVAMGWQDCHLHEFTVDGSRYGPRGWLDDGRQQQPKDETRAKLSRVAPAGGELTYWYDFGDDWFHDIAVEKVEKVASGAPGADGPVCLSGRRACPPEDCGGVWGYEHLLEVLGDPSHEEYDELSDWVGGDLDPEHFELAEVNARLGYLRRVAVGAASAS